MICETEQFSAAICHLKELEETAVLIFGNGRLVFTGLKVEKLRAAKKLPENFARIV